MITKPVWTDTKGEYVIVNTSSKEIIEDHPDLLRAARALWETPRIQDLPEKGVCRHVV